MSKAINAKTRRRRVAKVIWDFCHNFAVWLTVIAIAVVLICAWRWHPLAFVMLIAAGASLGMAVMKKE